MLGYSILFFHTNKLALLLLSVSHQNEIFNLMQKIKQPCPETCRVRLHNMQSMGAVLLIQMSGTDLITNFAVNCILPTLLPLNLNKVGSRQVCLKFYLTQTSNTGIDVYKVIDSNLKTRQ